MSNAEKAYRRWLEEFPLNEEEKAELLAIEKQPEDIENRFWSELKFGTAGLRAVMGPGCNRMNRFTVARAAKGFAAYICEKGEQAKQDGVVISYDSRHNSRFFAELTARILVGAGVHVHFASELHPVPMTSFAIRWKKAAGGVMITASHNPREYNGFKGYGPDGAQFAPEAADFVASRMPDDYADILQDVPELLEAQSSPLWHWLGDEWDEAYFQSIEQLCIKKDVILKQKDLKIVYTPIYGTGKKPIERILRRIGFENIHIVKEQALPDPEFPTAPYPNPEMSYVLDPAIAIYEKEKADVLIATDPDADRLAVAVRNREGKIMILTGNQIGAILMDYILRAKESTGTMPEKPYCVTTVVSGKMPRKICQHYGVKLYETLTGFKFIAEIINKHSDLSDENFLFGFEESFGYLSGKDVRDKDAIVSAMMICELSAVARDEGKTFADTLEDLYRKYGYTAEKTVSFERPGKEGVDIMQNAMKQIRDRAKDIFLDDEVVAAEIAKLGGMRKYTDILRGKEYDFKSAEESDIDLAKSDVLLFELGDGKAWFAVRPSGTEPKIKVYSGVTSTSEQEAQQELQALVKAVSATVEALL